MIIPTILGDIEADMEYVNKEFAIVSFNSHKGRLISLTHMPTLKAAYEVKSTVPAFCRATKMCDWMANNWSGLLEFAVVRPYANLILRTRLQECHDKMWVYFETLD